MPPCRPTTWVWTTPSKGAILPIPKNGLELAFNNLLPFRSFNGTIRDNANVLSDGNIAWGRTHNRSMALLNSPEEAGKPLEGKMAQEQTSPSCPSVKKALWA